MGTGHHVTATKGQRQLVTACDLLEEVANALEGAGERARGEEEGCDVITEGEDGLTPLANQIHLLMDSAPIKSNGESIHCEASWLMSPSFQITLSWMSIG